MQTLNFNKCGIAPRKITLSEDVGYCSDGRYRCLQNLPKSNERLYLRYAGEEWCEAGYIFDIPREEYHLHFVLEGKGVFALRNKRHHLKAGDMFLVPPGEPNYYQADEHAPWHYMWVSIGGENAWPYLKKAGFSEGCFARKANARMEPYVRLVYEILEYPQLTYAHTLRRMGILYELLALLITNNTKNAGPKSQKILLERAMRFVQENYQTCTVAQMAAFAGVTRNYLFTLFKQETQQSPRQYLTRYRMEKAASLLAHTEKRVADIAHAVGYEDPLSFSKAFKQYYKVSPLAYKKIDLQSDFV